MIFTYGIGKNHTQGYWYDLFIRLFAKKLITIHNSIPTCWQLTHEGRKMLKQHKEHFSDCLEQKACAIPFLYKPEA